MISFVKDKITDLFIGRRSKTEQFKTRSFKDFFNKSFMYLVLMPDNDTDFHYAIEVLKGLNLYKKHATVFTRDFRANLVPMKFKSQVIEYTDKDVGRFNIPSRKLMERLTSLRFNVVLDLNRKDNMFCSIVAGKVNASIKVEFRRSSADKYYNLQISTKEENVEQAYKNYINCLAMF